MESEITMRNRKVTRGNTVSSCPFPLRTKYLEEALKCWKRDIAGANLSQHDPDPGHAEVNLTQKIFINKDGYFHKPGCLVTWTMGTAICYEKVAAEKMGLDIKLCPGLLCLC